MSKKVVFPLIAVVALGMSAGTLGCKAEAKFNAGGEAKPLLHRRHAARICRAHLPRFREEKSPKFPRNQASGAGGLAHPSY